jgi:hypothetical protein
LISLRSFDREQLVLQANLSHTAVASPLLYLLTSKGRFAYIIDNITLQNYKEPAVMVYDPVFDRNGSLNGIVIQTFLVDTLMHDLLLGVNSSTTQFIVSIFRFKCC